MLSWTAGDGAQAHDVYFGRDAQAVADATTATADIYPANSLADQTSFIPGDLDWNADVLLENRRGCLRRQRRERARSGPSPRPTS